MSAPEFPGLSEEPAGSPGASCERPHAGRVASWSRSGDCDLRSVPVSEQGTVHPFRFVQTSDLRLDTPCFGIPHLPDDLSGEVVEPHYQAVRRVVDAAIEHDADFVILAGGLLDPERPGLRGPWFLAEQFRRLAEHAIDVYWAGASGETHSRWPAQLDLPTNVHRLAVDQTGLLHAQNGTPIARLIMLPVATRPHVPGGAFTIAVQPGCQDVPEHRVAGVDFWALGGRPDSETMQVGQVVAHFAGSPQGHCPAERGRHSCSLVDVDVDRTIHIRPVDTDIVRWHHVHIEIPVETSWSSLEQRMEQRLAEVRAEGGAAVNFLAWTVTGGGPAIQRLLQPRLCAELIERLNARPPGQFPLVWTVSIDAIVAAAQRTDWQHQKTPLGAFLRELEEVSPHVQEWFGRPADQRSSASPEPPGGHEELIQHVINEGVHWLGTGTDGGLTRRAG